MKTILLAGATGYLGGYILEALLAKDQKIEIIVRNPSRLADHLAKNDLLSVTEAELTRPEQLTGCCMNSDIVISTVGITNQKDGLTYMDVDYRANLNLLNEAKKSGVRKFIYVSVFNGNQLKRLKICEAKEKFVDALKKSGLDYCIIRPTGYFSDMAEFYKMAKKGRIFLFGNGEHKTNPIHGKDLARICVAAIRTAKKEISVGGPQILTHNQIAETAFSVTGNKLKITRIPDWVRKSVLFLLRTFTSSKIYGPIEFFMTVLSMDLIAPEYGTHTLKDYFLSISSPAR